MIFNSELSGRVITNLVKQLRLLDDEGQALTAALSVLCNSVGATGGSLWQIGGDQLVVTAEHRRPGDDSRLKTTLDRKTSQQLVMSFLAEFSGLDDAEPSPVYPSSYDSKSLNAILNATRSGSDQIVVPLRAKGMFLGILAIQFEHLPRWTDEERLAVQETSDLLSMVIYQCTQISRMRTDAEDWKLLDSIRTSLSLAGCASKRDVAVDLSRAIAKRFHFRHCALFLLDGDGKSLTSNEKTSVPLSEVKNPIVETFLSKRLKRIIDHKIRDRVDGYVLPLVSDEQSAGVLLLDDADFSDALANPYEREIALTLTVELSKALFATTTQPH